MPAMTMSSAMEISAPTPGTRSPSSSGATIFRGGWPKSAARHSRCATGTTRRLATRHTAATLSSTGTPPGTAPGGTAAPRRGGRRERPTSGCCTGATELAHRWATAGAVHSMPSSSAPVATGVQRTVPSATPAPARPTSGTTAAGGAPTATTLMSPSPGGSSRALVFPTPHGQRCSTRGWMRTRTRGRISLGSGAPHRLHQCSG
mmetsp:Transcript_21389/g.61909  ORF Transcript_21389/g.61909 Transcript_21389/m.61909 type:complete len:204 (+) Transcript_21389:308-919(+)